MYTFGIAVLLGLGVLAVSMLASMVLHRYEAVRVLTFVALGIGAAWLADFNMWTQWGLPVRYDWVGITFTGIMIGGIALFWYVTVQTLSTVVRKVSDEAETIEKTQHLHRVA